MLLYITDDDDDDDDDDNNNNITVKDLPVLLHVIQNRDSDFEPSCRYINDNLRC
jgi:hypothetical protein